MATALDANSVGPVDVAVILFEGNKPGGDVAPAASGGRSGMVATALAFGRTLLACG